MQNYNENNYLQRLFEDKSQIQKRNFFFENEEKEENA